jgi:hypothetical protein
MNPWDTPEGQACFERWIAEATRLFNAYNGSPEFSARKPWSFNKYGILEGSPYGPHSVHAPDDFPFFSNNKYGLTIQRAVSIHGTIPYGMERVFLTCTNTSPNVFQQKAPGIDGRVIQEIEDEFFLSRRQCSKKERTRRALRSARESAGVI